MRNFHITLTGRSAFSVLLFLISFYSATAQTWQPLGARGFTTLGTSIYNNLVFDSNNTPYMASANADENYLIGVYKYDGTDWLAVGDNPPSVADCYFVCLQVDGNDVPYVAFTEGFGGNIRVMKLDGTDWVSVGTFGAGGFELSLALDDSDVPYLAYSEDDFAGQKASVKKFDGTNWEFVGAPAFSSGEIYGTMLKFDNTNIPYVAYGESVGTYTSVVRKFDGTNWASVGGSNFAGTPFISPSLAFDAANSPYVAFSDINVGPTLMKFDGTTWNQLGNSNFVSGPATPVDMIIDGDGYPVLGLYSSLASTAIVVRYDGTDWVNMGDEGFANNIFETYFTQDKNGDFYMVFADGSNSFRATVMHLDVVLPLTWHSFTAKPEDKNILLHWETEQEQNTRDFIVQHHSGNNPWKDIATLSAAGNSSSIKSYSFLHTSPDKGKNYYRIKQRDLDDRFTISEVRAVSLGSAENLFTILGNPVTNGSLKISVTALSGIPAQTFTLHNAEGKLVWSNRLQPGVHNISTTGFRKGIYFLSGGNKKARIIIQ